MGVEYSGIFVPGWPRSLEKSEEEEAEKVIKSAPLAVGAGAVGAAGANAKSLGSLWRSRRIKMYEGRVTDKVVEEFRCMIAS